MRSLFTVLILGTLFSAARGEDADAAKWGTIKGRIVWDGPAPKPSVLKVNKDEKDCLAKGPINSEELVVDPSTKAVANVFVWLGADPKTPPAIHPKLKEIKDKVVAVDQPCCAFVPHALGLRVGQTLDVKNSAAIPHNASFTGGPRDSGLTINQLIAPGKELKIDVKSAGRLPVSMACSIHPWMTAKVGVYNHPYFVVTGPDGTFEIVLAPAGAQKLMIWQEKVGYRTGVAGKGGEDVTIKGGGVTDLGDLKLKE